MKFDDDQLDMQFGYTPTVAKGSRSASMKKLTRKNENKPAPPKPQETKKADIDLLDELLGPQPTKKQPEKSKVNKSYGLDSVDSFFDDPSPKKSPSKISKLKIEKPAAQKQSPLTLIDDGIIEQEPKLTAQPQFKNWRPGSAINIEKSKKIKDDEPIISISPSLRSMKPPLRRRQSKDMTQSRELQSNQTPLVLKQVQDKNPPANLSLTISQQPESKKSFTLYKDRDDDRNIPKKRPSIEGKHGQLKLTLGGDSPKNASLLEQRNKNSLQLQDSIMIDDQPSYPRTHNHSNNNTINKYISPPTLPKYQQNTSQYTMANNNKKQGISMVKNTDISSIDHNYNDGQNNALQQKQMQTIIKNYQMHINSLQGNLQQQIQSNKQTRVMLMKQADAMINNERNRLQKLHQDQVDRIKQMLTWEKGRVQSNYKLQIERLKKQLEESDRNYSTVNNPNFAKNTTEADKKEIKYLEEKLRMQRKSIEDRQKMLDRRQYQLQQRERQFLKKKKLEEEQLRQEHKKVMMAEMESKKQIVTAKRKIQSQKHDYAAQFTQLQLQSLRKNQKLQELSLQLQNQRHQIQRQKQQMRKLNRQYFGDLKLKQEQLKAKEEYLTKIESELISKIKVIQARASKLNAEETHTGINMTTIHKQNNWVINNQIQGLRRPSSANNGKIDTQQRKVADTQNRFHNISHSIRENLKLTHTGKQSFNLDQYLLSMAKFTRTRNNYIA